MGSEIVHVEKRSSASLFGVIRDDAKRIGKISSVLRRFGFGNLVKAFTDGIAGDYQTTHEIVEAFKTQQSDMASKLREMLEELGTTYIKFGQMLSTRYDLLPQSIIQELSKLQDGSPAMPFETVENILNEAYHDYHKFFSDIDQAPLGSASIAQVHRATLTDGSQVVIKVQRPGLLSLVRSDIDIIHILAKALDNSIEEIAYFDLPSLISEFERSIVSELDFTHERENIEYFMQTYGDNPMFVFPEPNVELTRRNILVMREIKGKKITQIEPNTELAHKMSDEILKLAFDMVLRDGVFHADPHPGNIFATPDDRIGILDFGLIGNFTSRQREEFMRIVMAIQFGDCGLIASSLLNLGRPTRRVIIKDLETDISTILHKYYRTSLQKIDVVAFANEFVAAGQRYGVQIPSEFMNAIRALINIEGILVYLNPEIDLIATLGNLAKRMMLDSFSKENIPNHVFRWLLEAEDLGRTVPAQLLQLMQDAGHDGIAMRLSSQSVFPVIDSIHGFATRISLSMMLIGLTISLFLAGYIVLFDILLVLDTIWVFFLMIWHIKGRSSRKRLRIHPMINWIRRQTNRY